MLRIFPVFYFYLIILALLNPLLGSQVSPLHFFSTALYIQNFTPWGSTWLIGHTWSLAVEEQFYLLWPMIFKKTKNLNRLSTLGIAVFLGSMFRIFHYKFPSLSTFFLAPFFMHADFLFSGCFIAFLAFYYPVRLVSLTKNISPFAIYCSIFLIWLFSKFEFHPVYDKFFIPISGAIINLCVSFLIVYFVFKADTIGYRFLNLPGITFIGRLSYSLYVWQQLFTSKYDFWWSKFPQNICFTFLAAYFSYRFIEKPFLHLKEKFRAVPEPKLSPVDI